MKFTQSKLFHMNAGCLLRYENNVIRKAGTESFYFCFKMCVLSTDVQTFQIKHLTTLSKRIRIRNFCYLITDSKQKHVLSCGMWLLYLSQHTAA